jgi:hypothetical protein
MKTVIALAGFSGYTHQPAIRAPACPVLLLTGHLVYANLLGLFKIIFPEKQPAEPAGFLH